MIFDNLLVASELVHWLKGKTGGKTGWMAVKVDMSKAYDMVEWSFLEKTMLKMGFTSIFTQNGFYQYFYPEDYAMCHNGILCFCS